MFSWEYEQVTLANGGLTHDAKNAWKSRIRVSVDWAFMTVGQPVVITPPCAVASPSLLAIRKLINTPDDPIEMTSGGPVQIAVSETRAAGLNPIMTFGLPVMMGPPTWGTGPGLIRGQTCKSLIRAAGFLF